MGITKDEYCMKVCGAKCCTLWEHKHTCKHLGKGCECTVYKERFKPEAADVEAVDYYVAYGPDGPQLKPFWCTRVEILLKHNLMPEWMRKKCCYAHPEILEK